MNKVNKLIEGYRDFIHSIPDVDEDLNHTIEAIATDLALCNKEEGDYFMAWLNGQFFAVPWLPMITDRPQGVVSVRVDGLQCVDDPMGTYRRVTIHRLCSYEKAMATNTFIVLACTYYLVSNTSP